MNLLEIIQGPFLERFAWTLIHFVWQGAALAGLLAVALRSQLGSNANVRYALAVATMLAMVLCPLTTMFFI